MGEPALSVELGSEQAFAELAASCARAWRAARAWPLVLGLTGDLGSGKTTWIRAMLRALGYSGRVPSPTYTLLEQYACGELTVVHLDLYRLRGGDELEHLGMRDWLAEPVCWIAVEWPERAPQLAARCDLTLAFGVTGPTGRRIEASAATGLGIEALRSLRHGAFNNKP
ncbi:MAG TPA: tRNA (adenosine(37)-N6)-threonylcarbamoyltransferase complex ATPase subunit type 1 TsaE [Gammaproteobacteria bacterium]|nr:tRNA (adenosine(37)-N6)-threonylcarbamoyltransferase complex ATPase subunit type 1 TsaE [Gammaproteobacteria bacterium]